jgi:PAS domain S-box-containing protein
MSNPADMSTQDPTAGARLGAIASLALERMARSPVHLIETLPIGIYTCDLEGRLIQFNRRAAELLGGLILGQPVPLPDGTMAEVMASGQPVRDRELIASRPHAETLTLLANADPLYDEQGMLVGVVACIQDITELSRARRQIKEGSHVVGRLLEALPVALYTTDAEGRLTYYNKAAEALWGHTPKLGEQHWCGSFRIELPDGTDVPLDQCPMAAALKEQRPQVGPEACIVRPDGTKVPCLPYPTPLFDRDGKLIGGVNMLLDISDAKRAHAEQRGLIDELNHRVKNTLATIQSLAAQTLRGAHGISEREFEGRLLALSRIHDQLTRNAWAWADLETVARGTLAGTPAAHLRIEGPSVHLTSRVALALGMVLHELAANAAKHGALSTGLGSVSLTWTLAPGKLLIDWQEKDGPPVVPPRKRGFGTRLLERAVAHELGGKPALEFNPGGVHCTMDIPLPE